MATIFDTMTMEYAKSCPKDLTRQDAIIRFAAMVTSSALNKAQCFKCQPNHVIFILTEDTGDDKGVSHVVKVSPISDVRKMIAANDIVCNTNVMQLFEEHLASRSNDQSVVVNYFKNIGKISEGVIKTEHDKYWLIDIL